MALCPRMFCGQFTSSPCVLHAVVNLTTRREEVCFSVWQCRLYARCPTRLAVFSYGSLNFRFDSESSFSLQVMPGLLFRLQGLRACSCFAETNVLMALFCVFHQVQVVQCRCVQWCAGSRSHQCEKSGDTPFTVAPALNEWSRRGRVLVLTPLGVQSYF